MENRFEFKAWDPTEKVMLTYSPFSSFHGCDSSDGQENRSDRRAVMTWNGACYSDGVLLNLIMLQYTGIRTGLSQAAKIYDSDLLKYNNKLWRVEYSEKQAGYVLSRHLEDFGEEEELKLNSDIAQECDHYGSFYLNHDVVEVEKTNFLKENVGD